MSHLSVNRSKNSIEFEKANLEIMQQKDLSTLSIQKFEAMMAMSNKPLIVLAAEMESG